MANYVQTAISMVFPDAAARAACLADLEGPSDWVVPLDAYTGWDIDIHAGLRAELSAHARRQLTSRREQLVEKFRAWRAVHAPSCPDWMPVSESCLRVYLYNPDLLADDRVPLSLPRLLPYENRTEFDTALPPGPRDNGLWTMATTRNSGCAALRHAKIGAKHPPHDITLTHETLRDHPAALIRFLTPWSPVSDLAGLLQPVLARHGAVGLIWWVEDQGFGEFRAITPGGTWIVEDIEIEDYAVPDADGPEGQIFDHEALDARSIDLVAALLGEIQPSAAAGDTSQTAEAGKPAS